MKKILIMLTILLAQLNANWQVDTRIDAMTDKKQLVIYTDNKDGFFGIRKIDNDYYGMIIAYKNFFNTSKKEIMVRVDKNDAKTIKVVSIEDDKIFFLLNDFIAQIKSGNTIKIRADVLNNRYATFEYSLDGFSGTFKQLEHKRNSNKWKN